MKHTPLPWETNTAEGRENEIWSANDSYKRVFVGHALRHVETATPQGRIDAAFIVRACNAHDELVSAVRSLLGCIDTELVSLSTVADEALSNTMASLRDALSKAEGR